MSNLDLDAAQALTDAATEGPWVAIGHDFGSDMDGWLIGGCERGVVSVDNEGGEYVSVPGHPRQAHADAAFIAWARTGVPQLIARIRELERQASDK